MRRNHAWSACCRCSLAVVAWAIIGRTSAAAQSPASPEPIPGVKPAVGLAFRNVTVIDVTDGRQLPGRTVVVVGNRIRAVGPAHRTRLPKGVQVIDGTGKYLIPGLWDMHAHVDDLAPLLNPLFLANGVTGLREMAQRFNDGGNGADSFRVWQPEVLAGTRLGPRVVGPSADLGFPTTYITTTEQARRVIDSLKAAGDAFVKLHAQSMPRDIYFSIAREARRVGLPFVGHVPREVTEAEASDSGQRSIEHVEESHRCWDWLASKDPTGEEQCRAEAKVYLRNGTWVVPTAVMSYYLGHNMEVTLRFVRLMHEMGVPMLAGSDSHIIATMGEPKFRQGHSLHEELGFFVQAGLTPLEALQAATLGPAKFLNATDSLGTIAAGKLADLVLLNADPLIDIRNTTTIDAVVANGRYFDRATVDKMGRGGVP